MPAGGAHLHDPDPAPVQCRLLTLVSSLAFERRGIFSDTSLRHHSVAGKVAYNIGHFCWVALIAKCVDSDRNDVLRGQEQL